MSQSMMASQFASTIPASLPAISQSSTSSSAYQSQTSSSTASSSHAPTVAERLATLSNKFEGFHQELDLSRNQKKQDDQKKVLALQTQLTALRDSLALETKNRAIAMKALQSWLDDRITQWAREVEAPIARQLAEIAAKVDALAIRTEALEIHQVKNKDLIPKLIEQRSSELLTQISDIKVQIEQEQNLRVEREKRVYVKIQDLGHRLREQLLAEKALTDKRLAEVRTDVSVETKARQTANERMHKLVEQETVKLKHAVEGEKQERLQAVDQLVQALNHYGGALQAGIKIVATQ